LKQNRLGETDATSVLTESLFGSMTWQNDSLLWSIGHGISNSRSHTSNATNFNYSDNDAYTHGNTLVSSNQDGIDEVIDQTLVSMLFPFKEKYLNGVLGRLTQPISQMFPEMEGYSGELM